MKKTSKKIPTVTVGIPVFNEEANIGKLLRSIALQKELDYKLSQIIIVCDASTDRTYKIVSSFNDSRKLHLKNPVRSGQQFSQNVILRNSTSDITVILEGDILLGDNLTISKLVQPLFNSNDKIGLSVGRACPVEAKSFYEKLLNYGFGVKSGLFSQWKNGNNVYTARGQSMKAISKRFANVLIWPKHVPEDSYIYLSLIKAGYKMVVVPDAISYMRNVTNFRDRLKKVRKFRSGKKELEFFFTPQFVKNEYALPISLIVKHFLTTFLRNPFWTLLYVIEIILNRIFTMGNKGYTAFYDSYISTKNLNTI